MISLWEISSSLRRFSRWTLVRWGSQSWTVRSFSFSGRGNHGPLWGKPLSWHRTLVLFRERLEKYILCIFGRGPAYGKKYFEKQIEIWKPPTDFFLYLLLVEINVEAIILMLQNAQIRYIFQLDYLSPVSLLRFNWRWRANRTLWQFDIWASSVILEVFKFLVTGDFHYLCQIYYKTNKYYIFMRIVWEGLNQPKPPDLILGSSRDSLPHVELMVGLPYSFSTRSSAYFFELMILNCFCFYSSNRLLWTWFFNIRKWFSSSSSFLLLYYSSMRYRFW